MWVCSVIVAADCHSRHPPYLFEISVFFRVKPSATRGVTVSVNVLQRLKTLFQRTQWMFFRSWALWRCASHSFQVRPVTAALHNGTTDSGICTGSAGIARRLLGVAAAPRSASRWERPVAPRPAHQDAAWRWRSAETEAAHTGVHSVNAPALRPSRRSPCLPFFFFLLTDALAWVCVSAPPLF